MGWKVARQSGGLQLTSAIFIKMLQNIAKPMAYIIKEPGGDFQQGKGSCLYEPTSDTILNEHPSTCGCVTGLRIKPQKSRPVNFLLRYCSN